MSELSIFAQIGQYIIKYLYGVTYVRYLVLIVMVLYIE